MPKSTILNTQKNVSYDFVIFFFSNTQGPKPTTPKVLKKGDKVLPRHPGTYKLWRVSDQILPFFNFKYPKKVSSDFGSFFLATPKDPNYSHTYLLKKGGKILPRQPGNS